MTRGGVDPDIQLALPNTRSEASRGAHRASAQPPRVGGVLAIGAGTAFGCTGIASRHFYDAGGTPFQLLAVKGVAISLVLLLIYLRRRRPWPKGRALPAAAGLGVIYAAGSFSVLVGLDRAPVALIVLLLYVYPVLVGVGASVLFRERLGRVGACALVLSMIGLIMAVGGVPDSASVSGILLGLGGAIATSTYVLCSRPLLNKFDPTQFSLITTAAPAVAIAMAVFAMEVGLPPTGAIAWALVFVALAVAGQLAFVTAVKLVGPGPTSIMATVEPAVAVFLAWTVLGEVLDPIQLFGGAVIVSSALLVVVSRPRVAQSPQPHA